MGYRPNRDSGAFDLGDALDEDFEGEDLGNFWKTLGKIAEKVGVVAGNIGGMFIGDPGLGSQVDAATHLIVDAAQHKNVMGDLGALASSALMAIPGASAGGGAILGGKSMSDGFSAISGGKDGGGGGGIFGTIGDIGKSLGISGGDIVKGVGGLISKGGGGGGGAGTDASSLMSSTAAYNRGVLSDASPLNYTPANQNLAANIASLGQDERDQLRAVIANYKAREAENEKVNAKLAQIISDLKKRQVQVDATGEHNALVNKAAANQKINGTLDKIKAKLDDMEKKKIMGIPEPIFIMLVAGLGTYLFVNKKGA